MNQGLMNTFEIIGTITGLAGAALVAFNDRRLRLAGFSIWLVSNGAWIGYALLISAHWMLGMFSFYLVTTVLGIFNTWPRKVAGDELDIKG
jgi:uncharacterized membrane protein YuzA (DUF378 family)